MRPVAVATDSTHYLPRSLAERTYTDIRRWTVMPHGGHFAAMEQPAALADDIRVFFRPLRQ